jgi:hypothetical protein
MKSHTEHIIVNKWLPLLKEYEKVKRKESKYFKRVKDLLSAYHVTKRDLYKYYYRWVESGRRDKALLPKKRGAKIGSRRTPKEIERNFIKAYRKLGYNSYEMVLLFKPYYEDKTPCPRTVDHIRKRYPLNKEDKGKIKRYERSYPGELGHMDLYYLPNELSAGKKMYVAALEDDCTRLGYTEVLEDMKSWSVAGFLMRGLCWFLKRYGMQFEGIMSDNGREFKGNSDHPVEKFMEMLSIKHYYTRPGRPQTNGKVEAFFKIMQNELVRAVQFKDIEDFKEQLGNFIYEYNHLRRHGGIDYITPFDKLEKVSKLLT